ncbi:MAG: YggS family pyridoxal phosphate-dependent enzyme [Gammaproteobacteria bacterium]|nr:YggS family pyridoxal phosphate-dependent enzyme [Gammaproteobacteria bacterium]
METIASRLAAVRARIAAAEAKARRPAGSVRLLAVSKTYGADAVREAHAAGQSAFGENYVQEGAAKLAACADLPLAWHFIGPLQANKTRAVAEAFAWVQSVDRERIARRLAEQRPAHLPPLNVCLQVNISGEASKSGIAPAELPALADQVAALPGLALRGLMAIPEATEDEAAQRRAFAALRGLFERLRATHPGLDTLSMGMSGDLEAAIAEGATLVRVGTAIFGSRTQGQLL